MEKENRMKAQDAPEADEPQDVVQPAEKTPFWRFSLRGIPTKRYISYVLFLVAIGMVYIWNSHVAEQQVKEEARLRKEIADAKAEYKTKHARLSASTRRQVIFEKVDSLGLRATSNNVHKLTSVE